MKHNLHSHRFGACCFLLGALAFMPIDAAKAQTAPPAALSADALNLQAFHAPMDGMWGDSLDLSRVEQDFGSAHAGKSVENKPLSIGGVAYAHGIGTHAGSTFIIDLKGVGTRFVSDVGVDDEKKGSLAAAVVFEIWVDGKRAAFTPVLHANQPARRLSVDLTGAKQLKLIVTPGAGGIDSDHADWGGALLVLVPGAAARPEAFSPAHEPTAPIYMGGDAPAPAIHGPRVVGATPGRPFLFRIPATGEGPLTFSAKDLPAGLTLDGHTGIISGTIPRAGQRVVSIAVHGAKGEAHRKLAIVCGVHKLSLTPPMGWNSWNVWAGAVNADRVRAAADAFGTLGLAAHGFAYVNIDDCWEGARGTDGVIQTNAKFGDMKALADYVHAQGLKLGIYSSPGPRTCAGFTASYQFEKQDALTYAAWGVDYLKYDWCSYGGIAKEDHSLLTLQKPYAVMRVALDAAPRDIVYSLCQYGMGDSWTWAGSEPIDGNCWRTTGDIIDSWNSMAGIGFRQNGHETYAGPGHWNDPDMLVVGVLGWGRQHPTRLTGNEQITHISLWSLLSAPLLIGCDLTRVDPFTKALLTNDDVLDVDQDPIGRPASRKSVEGTNEVWARPLFDGTIAVGLFNRGAEAADVTAHWSDLGLKGRQPVRDLWQRQNLADANDTFVAHVPAHGAVLVKIGKPQRADYTP